MLLKCDECDGKVSDAAPVCPHCGAGPEVFLGGALSCAECGSSYRTAYPNCRSCGAPREVAARPPSVVDPADAEKSRTTAAPVPPRQSDVSPVVRLGEASYRPPQLPPPLKYTFEPFRVLTIAQLASRTVIALELLIGIQLIIATDSGGAPAYESVQNYFAFVASWNGLLTWIQVGLFLINASAFCWFIFRGLKYLNQLNPRVQTIGPGFAVWSNLIPIVNLFIPFMAMRDIWTGANELAGQPTKPPASLGLWWLLWLGTVILQTASSTTSRMADAGSPDAVSLYRTSLFLSLGSSVSMILSCLFLLSVANRATVAFDKARERILSGQVSAGRL